MAYSTTTLTGTYTLFDGTPARGVIEIIPSEKVVKDTTGDVILSGRVKVTLDAGGKFSVDLPSTDDTTLNPTGFGYTLVAKLHHQHIAAVSFSLPAGSPVDIEDVTPVDPSTFTPDATYVQTGELAAVATTGAYADLQGTPVIPATAADVNALPDTTTLPDLPGKATDAQLPDRLQDAALSGTIASEYDTDPGALAMQPSTATPAATVADPGGIRYPGWMSRDRSIIFNLQGVPTVNYSLDNGATWNGTVNALPNGVQAVRDLGDGEILVSAGDNPGSLYRSTGWATDKANATFTEVLTASSPNVYFHNSYGLWVEQDGLILAAEYGSKVANANARYVYLSRDHGKTWQTILDIGGTQDTHTHGVAYDKWWKRIWVTRGDASRAIYYTDDLGQTWDTVSTYNTGYASASQSKVTTIFPMAGCVLFMSDSAPNGVLRIRRQNRDNPVLEEAHRLNDSSGITHIGQLAYRANLPGAPVLMSFTNDPSGGYTGPGVLVATTDGFRFWEIWTDTIDYGAFGGLVSCVGPTTDGKYLGTLIDGRQTRYSRLTVTAPTWTAPALPKASNAIGDETMPRTAAASEVTPISGTLVLSYLTATQTRAVSMLRAFTASVPAAAGATLFRIGLYRVDDAGNLTLIAAGANDTTKITTAYSSVAQTVSTRVTAGGRYAVGVLCVGGGTMPSLAGITAAATSGTRLPMGALFIDPKISAQVTGQSDLPATIASGSLAACARVIWHALA